MNPGPADGTVGTDRTDSTNAHPGWSRGAGAVAVVALAVAYGVAGWLGLLVASDPGNVTALWPPSGIALASLLLWGRRLWPGVLLGAFVMNVVMFPNHSGDGVAILGAGLIALGSTIEIVLAATLIDRVEGRRLLQSPRYLVGFMGACAVAATVAATAGLTATVGIGGAAVDRLTFWSTWWIGDVVGMLVIGPVVCGGPLLVHRKAEWLLTLTLTVAVGEAVFNRPFGLLGGTTLPVVWLILPAVMWSATRLDPRAIAIHTLLIHVLASWGTVAGFGPLAGHGGVGLVILDGLLIVTNATGLMLASTARQLDVANRTLEARVAERGRALEGAWADAARELEEKDRLRAILVEAQKQEALGRLAGGVAHDFNNLLTVIRAEADFISHSTVGAEIQETASTIVAAADRAADLTHQLLAVARRPMGRAEVVDVGAAITGFQRLARPALPASIHFEVLAGPAAQVRIDPGHFDQVLLNLVLNAKDALLGAPSTSARSLQITWGQRTLDDDDARTLGVPAAGRWVAIDVTDTGEGIDPEALPYIFEPFFTTKSAGRGTGLGLPTAAGIIGQAGGALRVHSTPGSGTTFQNWLPSVVVDGERPFTVQPQSTASEVRVPVSPRTILIAEDDPLVRRTIIGILVRHGHRVLAAVDGVEALALFRAHHDVDLVITDVVMPRMGGLALLGAIRALRPVPVLVVSGYHEHDDGLGGERLLQKPFSVADFDQAVDDALRAGAVGSASTAR